MGWVLEKETSKWSIGAMICGGVVSIVTPVELPMSCCPDAVVAWTVM